MDIGLHDLNELFLRSLVVFNITHSLQYQYRQIYTSNKHVHRDNMTIVQIKLNSL